jgi:hypothetical protein
MLGCTRERKYKGRETRSWFNHQTDNTHPGCRETISIGLWFLGCAFSCPNLVWPVFFLSLDHGLLRTNQEGGTVKLESHDIGLLVWIDANAKATSKSNFIPVEFYFLNCENVYLWAFKFILGCMISA